MVDNVQDLPETIRKKIKTHNIDSTTILDDTLKYDLILFDPPWGGNDYKQGKDEEFN